MSALDAFWVAPSGALLAALNVKQLNSVAKHYSIDVTLPKGAKKSQLLDCILTCLIDRDVLPDERWPEDSKGASGSDSEPTSDSERTSSSKVGRRLRKRSIKQKTLEWEQEIERKSFDDELAQKRLDKELDHKRLEAAQKDKDRELELERFKHLEQEREIKRTRLQLVAEGKLGKSTSQQSGLASMIKFLPKFNERDPDVFFSLFENIASEQNWGDEDKTVLLQTALIGRAQKAFVALPSSEKKVYQCVKTAVLKCYELVPEVYRQRFRLWKKSDKQTYAEWARDLTSFFQGWLTAEEVYSFEELCDLLILEQLKNTLPDRVATYVNEHHVKTAADGAVLADNYALIHKTTARDFSPHSDSNYRQRSRVEMDTSVHSDSVTHGKPSDFDPRKDCNYCFGKNHWKINCPVLLERKRGKGEEGKFGLCSSSVPAQRQWVVNKV
ncbi:Zinc finger protein 24 [Merluccius polli]|uniref:Zinc finger protein 24 n=1 Tax=Merluccius polli TaxID=89951 RepID=A0AA47P9X7_MERPO|nr:Zinc finger protein 24 [Merluccius polli]